jgi:dTDP-4-amino-4,6-dideoxygalactose transaminase
VGLEIAVRALGLSGEVIVPSFTFVATAHCLQWLGITPVFCDVAPDHERGHNLDPRQVERLITARTSGILATHLWGCPCDVEALAAIAARHGLKLFFDAAHAFGCSYRGRMIGGWGDAEVFSFHATKFFNTFEGGAITTNDDVLAERLRLMHNFGFAGLDTVVSVGTNGKMSEMSAVMGLTGLEDLDEFVAVNRDNYHRYHQELDGLPGVWVLSYEEGEAQNYQYIVLEIEEARAGLSRDDLMAILQAERVRARRYFYPGCHRMEPYRSLYPDAGRRLPVTERLTECVLTLPTGTAVSVDQADEICDLIRFSLKHGSEVRSRLARP